MYCYSRLIEDIEKIKDDRVEVFSTGSSLMGRDIPCIKAGEGEKKLFIAGAYHGLEYLTSALIMHFLSCYLKSVKTVTDIFGYDAESLFRDVTLLAVPMVNPDGVDIAVNGIDLTNKYHRQLIDMVGIHDFGNVWQANARGVDINHNFDADWQSVKEEPSSTKYGGECADSESETRAVVNLIRKENVDMMIAFHSQGREIYYDFNGKAAPRSLEIAEKMAQVSGYEVKKPQGTAVFGGCKDWFIKEFGREGFTVEIGTGRNPLPLSMLGSVYEENARIILCVMQEM